MITPFPDPKSILRRFELSEFPQPEIIRLQYPVLLCHGYGSVAGLVRPSALHLPCMTLRKFGVHAFAPNTLPYGEIATRAGEWIEKIDILRERYGFEKFNVIGHSMAGLDIRYAIARLKAADRIASLTTIATPHRGTSIAELLLTTPDLIQDAVSGIFNFLGEGVYPKTKSDSIGALRQLTRLYVEETFNSEVEDHPGVHYYSYSAAVGKGTDAPLNPVYRFQNVQIYQREGENDSFVSKKSAIWGEHISTVPISHIEQMYIQVGRDRVSLVENFWKDVALNLQERGF